ncbi:hypothetical protein HZ994_11060 [Akkermansiaceae bacterium]|nr:hypothetical protein HZ994_11060 [Akkermansiaceae bacterium]
MKTPFEIRQFFFPKSPPTLRLLGAAGLLFLLPAPKVIAQFTPGAGGAVPALPELKEPGSSITSLWVSQSDRENLHFSSGNEPTLDLKFDSPASYGATAFDLQKSPDGINGWETLHTTFSAAQDNFSFNPGGYFFFRLLVHGGPRDGQVSNVVEGEITLFPTQVSFWSIGNNWVFGGPNAPWLGHGLIAAFQARNLSDSSQITGGFDFQWYRRNPQTGALVAIPGATGDTYTTTEDDLGGYRLVCRGTGDGQTVGGFAQVMAGEPVLIFNRAEAATVTRSGFTLNLFKSVPSLAPGDLRLSYWDGSAEAEIPVSSVTARPGNAVFDIVVTVPAAVTDAYLENNSLVWGIGSQFGDGEFAHQMPGLSITFPNAAGPTFGEWADETGIPADRRDPLDRKSTADGAEPSGLCDGAQSHDRHERRHAGNRQPRSGCRNHPPDLPARQEPQGCHAHPSVLDGPEPLVVCECRLRNHP